MTTAPNIRRSASHWNFELHCAECNTKTTHRIMLGNCYWDSERKEHVFLQDGTYGYCYDCNNGWEEGKLTEEEFQQIVAEMKEYNKRQFRPMLWDSEKKEWVKQA